MDAESVERIRRKKYFIYCIRKFFGIKTLGHSDEWGLVIFNFLEKYKLPRYSMNLLIVKEDLSGGASEGLHINSSRLDKDDFISVQLNIEKRQLQIFTGKNPAMWIDKTALDTIVQLATSQLEKDEIIGGIEFALKEVRKLFDGSAT